MLLCRLRCSRPLRCFSTWAPSLTYTYTHIHIDYIDYVYAYTTHRQADGHIGTLADHFPSYKLIRAQAGPAFDNATMERAVILDASIGPPYDVPSSASSPTSSPTASAGVHPPPPPPPNRSIVASCTSRLYISEDFGNYNGVLHGGAAGVIFDMLTTIALGPISRPGFWS